MAWVTGGSSYVPLDFVSRIASPARNSSLVQKRVAAWCTKFTYAGVRHHIAKLASTFRYVSTFSHGTKTSSQTSSASFSSNRDDSGLSKTLRARPSYETRETKLRPGVSMGIEKQTARSTSRGASGSIVPTMTSLPKTAAVPIIFAPRTTIPPSFSATTRTTGSSSAVPPAASNGVRDPCGLVIVKVGYRSPSASRRWYASAFAAPSNPSVVKTSGAAANPAAPPAM